RSYTGWSASTGESRLPARAIARGWYWWSTVGRRIRIQSARFARAGRRDRSRWEDRLLLRAAGPPDIRRSTPAAGGARPGWLWKWAASDAKTCSSSTPLLDLELPRLYARKDEDQIRET